MAKNFWASRMKTMVIDFACGMLVGVVGFSRSGAGSDLSFAEWLGSVIFFGFLFALFGRRLWRMFARAQRTGKGGTGVFTRSGRRRRPTSPD